MRPDDAPGRVALRPRVELLPRGRSSARSLPAERRSTTPRRRASPDTTTSRRAAVWRRDLFGTGKTSVKLNVGKYLQAAQNGLAYAALRPSGRLHDDTSRARGPTPTETSSLTAICRIRSPTTAATLQRRSATSAFGSEQFTSDLDQKLVSGWGVRPGDWQIRRVGPAGSCCRASRRRSATTRRWLTNFTWDDNVLQATNQFDDVQRHGGERFASAGRGARPDDRVVSTTSSRASPRR